MELAGVAEAVGAPGGSDDAGAIVALEEGCGEESVVTEAVVNEVLGAGEAQAALIGGEERELFGIGGKGGDRDADEADRFGHGHA